MINGDTLTRLRSLTDEIVADNVMRSGYSKFVALAVTDLENARLHLIAHMEGTGEMLLIDKAKYRDNLEATRDHIPKTVETDETERGVNVT